MGTITGLARETDASPVEPDRVSGLQDGDYVATTGKDGRFVLLDFSFGTTGGVVNLRATDAGGRQVQATAFEDPGILAEFVNLGRYNRAGDVVFNFELSPLPAKQETH